jgi:hypothetical protein
MSTSDMIALAALVVAAISGGGAVYAVVISKRALTWEQERDREGNEAKIEITFGHAMVDRPGPKVINLNNITPEPRIYELTVNVLNVGAKPEFIKAIWVEGSEPGGTGVDLPLDGDVELKPRARFGYRRGRDNPEPRERRGGYRASRQ